ncbi:unnamed protein product, partial [Scytosiphon promiscuus]
LDAGHLKGVWKGTTLEATGKDADNTLVHVATSICYMENGDNYKFLYMMMKKNHEMESFLNSTKTTLFTDQHLSHVPAINACLPNCWRRFCLKHLVSTLKCSPEMRSFVDYSCEEGS